MRKRYIYAVAILASSLWWSDVSTRAEAASQPPQSADQSALPSAPNPAASKDKSKTPAKAAQAPDASKSDAPNPVPQSSAKKPSTAEDNPFPEDVSRKAAAEAKAAAGGASAPDAPNSTTPNPNAAAEKQSQGSSSLDNTDKLGLDDSARQQLKLESPDGATDVYDPKRATEDVRAGKFYLKTGDYRGAYDRFKDAISFDHENVEAVFWLAEAAQKMNLGQEAAQNYQLYLEAVPDGPNAKVARKALGELASVRKP